MSETQPIRRMDRGLPGNGGEFTSSASASADVDLHDPAPMVLPQGSFKHPPARLESIEQSVAFWSNATIPDAVLDRCGDLYAYYYDVVVEEAPEEAWTRVDRPRFVAANPLASEDEIEHAHQRSLGAWREHYANRPGVMDPRDLRPTVTAAMLYTDTSMTAEADARLNEAQVVTRNGTENARDFLLATGCMMFPERIVDRDNLEQWEADPEVTALREQLAELSEQFDGRFHSLDKDNLLLAELINPSGRKGRKKFLRQFDED